MASAQDEWPLFANRRREADKCILRRGGRVAESVQRVGTAWTPIAVRWLNHSRHTSLITWQVTTRSVSQLRSRQPGSVFHPPPRPDSTSLPEIFTGRSHVIEGCPSQSFCDDIASAAILGFECRDRSRVQNETRKWDGKRATRENSRKMRQCDCKHKLV